MAYNPIPYPLLPRANRKRNLKASIGIPDSISGQHFKLVLLLDRYPESIRCLHSPSRLVGVANNIIGIL